MADEAAFSQHERAGADDGGDAPIVKIVPGNAGVSIWSPSLFGNSAGPHTREFLSRIFSVKEVVAVEIRRSEAFGRVHYESSTEAPQIWRKLSRALRRLGESHAGARAASAEDADATPLGVDALYLDGPSTFPVEVGRIGAALSTWRLRHRDQHGVRLSHPALRNRRDVAYRLEEELAAIFGVEGFSTSTLSASVAVRFDSRVLSVERLIRQLEQSWPRLLAGLDGPPSRIRLAIAGGLLGLAFTGQYLVPALRPVAVLGVALYGLPNVKNGTRQLVRLQVGLPALYSAGLAFTLLTGMPFSSAVMAVLMQLWPRLAHRTMTTSQRRLFAPYRRRATWARVAQADGSQIEVDIDTVRPGDLVAVREGEIVPIDGVVTEGLAAVDEEVLSGVSGALDKTRGDSVFAATFVRAGRLTVRVEKIGIDTVAGYIGSQLPHARIDDLPSSAEAERIANRNAKPALVLAGINLFATRLLRPSQAAIRPDYATAPRLSAQLAALHDLGEGLRDGIFFRNPAALVRLPATDIYVFDETAVLDRGQIEIADIISNGTVSADSVLGYAAAAFSAGQNERARALATESVSRHAPVPEVNQRTRLAGAVHYRDGDGRSVEIATAAYITATGITVPPLIRDGAAASSKARHRRSDEDSLLRPLWVLRDRQALGVVTFRRHGAPEGADVIAALRARNKRARFIYVSAEAQAAADAVAEKLGLSSAIGDLDAAGKAGAVKGLGRRTMWIGDGAAPGAAAAIEAAGVSISIAGAATAPLDAADIVLLQPGLRSLVPLRQIGRRHRADIATDYRVVYAANLLGVAGGLLAGFGSLEAGLTSNLGTAIVYARHWKQLHDLIVQVEARRAKLESLAHDESDRPIEYPYAGAGGAEEFVDHRPLDVPVHPGGSELDGV
jgi:manganese/zinc-transporting P-type ATPase C